MCPRIPPLRRSRKQPSAWRGSSGWRLAGGDFRLQSFVVAVFLALSATAQCAQLPAADALLERRVRTIAEELRCLVCQNQTIADSNADLAIDLRTQIREKLAAGMSEAAIKDYMVQRYGDFVLYRPPVKATTIVLWFGPGLLLCLGIVVLWRFLAHRAKQGDERPLSEDEHRRATALLDQRPD
jgi:cytochrome c-type biogenesis protein CcmH/NrfF